jgi:hypothetical protein
MVHLGEGAQVTHGDKIAATSQHPLSSWCFGAWGTRILPDIFFS